MGFLRVIFRFCGFCLIAAAACLDFVFRIWIPGRAGDRGRRTDWTHYWGCWFLRLLGIRLQVHGNLPTRGLLAANHLSYLDIVVFAGCKPLVFVSKNEVRWWPVIGLLTQCAGTLFIRREQRSDVKRLAEAFGPVLEAGYVITLFPEGTSTGGDRVLPFHSSLFEPAAANGWTVTPAWIGYEVPGGDASEQVAYWKDMTFLPHLLRLFALREIRATVRCGEPLPPGRNRKEMARLLHDGVCELARAEGRSLVPVDHRERFDPTRPPAAGRATERA
jgi:1-acyl-sn-glycerol-3-phosphate acyltransferase